MNSEMFKYSNFKSEKGFTLVEALVALVVLTIAIGPALYLSSSITSTTSVTQNNLIAANLAQEGVEVVRAIRDTNWFTNQSFDSGLSDGQYRIEWNSNSLISLGGNPPLKIDGGLYNYSTGNATIFRRAITLTKLSASDLRVVSDVTWTEKGNRNRDTKIESHLFNWR